jgi:hypothetical protein
MNCLMIETADRRKFFTYEKNFPMLIDFAKTFNAEISVVKLVEGQVLDLAELAPALCDAGYRRPRSNYEVIETKLLPRSNTRSAILKNADKIQNYIVEQFLAGEVVSLSSMKEKFRKYKLTTACFCNHIHRAMDSLEKKGYVFQKMGAGKYKAK